MHQFKVSFLNSVHLICDSYFNVKPEVEIGIPNVTGPAKTGHVGI